MSKADDFGWRIAFIISALFGHILMHTSGLDNHAGVYSIGHFGSLNYKYVNMVNFDHYCQDNSMIYCQMAIKRKKV